MAKRRLPRVLFEAIESRVEDDRGRYLVVLSKHDQSARLFDEVVSSPFGISPTGIAGVRMSPVRPNRAASPAGMRKPPHLRSDHLRREAAKGVPKTHAPQQTTRINYSITSSARTSSVGGAFSIVLRAAARRRTDRTST